MIREYRTMFVARKVAVVPPVVEAPAPSNNLCRRLFGTSLCHPAARPTSHIATTFWLSIHDWPVWTISPALLLPASHSSSLTDFSRIGQTPDLQHLEHGHRQSDVVAASLRSWIGVWRSSLALQGMPASLCTLCSVARLPLLTAAYGTTLRSSSHSRVHDRV